MLECDGAMSCHTSIDSSLTPSASDHSPTPSLATLVGCTHAEIAVLSTASTPDSEAGARDAVELVPLKAISSTTS